MSQVTAEKVKQLREATGAGMMDCKKALEHSHGDIEQASEWLRKNGIAKASKKLDAIAAEGIVKATVLNAEAAIMELNSQTDFVAKNEKFVTASDKILRALLDSKFVGNEDINTVKSEVKVDGHSLTETEMNLTATIGEKISLRRFEVIKGQHLAAYNHSNHRVSVIVAGDNVSVETLKDIAMHAAAMAPKFKSLNDIPQEFRDKEFAILKDQYTQSMKDKPAHILENIIKGALAKHLAETVLEEQPFVKDPSKKIKDLLGAGKLTGYIRYEVGEGVEKAQNNFAEEVRKAAGH